MKENCGQKTRKAQTSLVNLTKFDFSKYLKKKVPNLYHQLVMSPVAELETM